MNKANGHSTITRSGSPRSDSAVNLSGIAEGTTTPLRSVSIRGASVPLVHRGVLSHLGEHAHLAVILAFAAFVCRPDLSDLQSMPTLLQGAAQLVPGVPTFLAMIHVFSQSLGRAWADLVAHMGLGAFMTVGVFCYTTALYWSHALLMGVLDLSLRYPGSRLGAFARTHKIQDTRLVTVADWIKCGIVVARNQLLINIPVGIAMFGFIYPRILAQKFPDMLVVATSESVLASTAALTWTQSLPSLQQLGFGVTACVLAEEVLFYSTHRLFHFGPLYRRFHKTHHSFTAPIGLAATYAHPVEHLLSNLLPVLATPTLLGLHPFTALTWFTIALTTTVHHHSGYELPGWPSSKMHDFHHYSSIYQFGVLGILDRFLHTDGGTRYARYVAKYEERVHGGAVTVMPRSTSPAPM
ncbi:hypothetical protein BC828DRAFT_408955 [Blastocladiella britannica]|nr:hypothetical protein BC828DRAFT_408955 [Blastocladiella britannica]